MERLFYFTGRYLTVSIGFLVMIQPPPMHVDTGSYYTPNLLRYNA